jgi:hypothetical protein
MKSRDCQHLSVQVVGKVDRGTHIRILTSVHHDAIEVLSVWYYAPSVTVTEP